MTAQEMEKKIEILLNQLTVEEKIAMIHGNGLFQSGSVERLGIPSIKFTDGPMGIRYEFQNDKWCPIGHSDDYVTYGPSNSAVAATWNLSLAYEAGKVLGEEARGRGKDVVLAPGINIVRVPACGRNFEYMSEDPYLISKMVVPLVKGIQEADVAASVKHFALNNQETERLWVNVEVGERALRELYLPGFESAVKEANAYSIMGAYNLFRGEHCCQSKELLGDILRKEWKYDGMIVSDWSAVHDTKKAAESPLDMEMAVEYEFDDYYMANPLLKRIKDGEIKEEWIDTKVRNILRLMLRIHLIDVEDGVVTKNAGRKSGCYDTPQHRSKVLEVARESIVLLKNEDKTLPLSPSKIKKLLVIGDNAVRLHANGGGSAELKALYEISPLLGLKSQLGGNCEVTFAPGYYVPPKEYTDINWQETSTGEGSGQKEREEERKTLLQSLKDKQKEYREEAVALAKEADHVIVIGGLNHEYDVEGFDREDLVLPYEQDRLIGEVLENCPDAIIVMMAGNAVSMQSWKDKAKAIVWCSYSGMEGGNALAEVLLGKVNPSGRLPESIPYRMEDCGAIALGEYPGRALTKEEREKMNAHTTETYKDGIYVGYRYYEKYHVPVQYCFGHGLSYTTFSYKDLRVTTSKGDQADTAIVVTVTVTNTGAVAGQEVVQVYVGARNSKVDRPVKELKGFEKVALEPEESKEVAITLTKAAFCYYDTEEKRYLCENGEYLISVGSSLEEIYCKIAVIL